MLAPICNRGLYFAAGADLQSGPFLCCWRRFAIGAFILLLAPICKPGIREFVNVKRFWGEIFILFQLH
jgi:hypothetical protein